MLTISLPSRTSNNSGAIYLFIHNGQLRRGQSTIDIRGGIKPPDRKSSTRWEAFAFELVQ
jgi:hypothetical protein